MFAKYLRDSNNFIRGISLKISTRKILLLIAKSFEFNLNYNIIIVSHKSSVLKICVYKLISKKAQLD